MADDTFQLTIKEFQAMRATLEKSAEYANASAQEQRKMLASQLATEKQSLLQSNSASVQERLLKLADKRDAKKVSTDAANAVKERAAEEKNKQLLEGLHG